VTYVLKRLTIPTLGRPAGARQPVFRLGAILLVAALIAAAGGCSLITSVDLDVEGIDASYIEIPTDQGSREALVVQPDSIGQGTEQTPVPLVVALHGLGSDAEVMAKITGLGAEARDKGFLAAFGVGLDDSWNAGTCCGESVSAKVNDVQYLQALILTMEAQYPVDRSRVYLLGYSNGAMMTYRFMCEAAGLVAGAASVAGTNAAGCTMPIAKPFLQISGRDDPIVPIAGSDVSTAPGVGPTPSVAESVAKVGRDFDCPRSTEVSLGPVTETRRAPCRDGAQVVFDVVDGAGHGWPIGEPFATTGRVLQFWGLA